MLVQNFVLVCSCSIVPCIYQYQFLHDKVLNDSFTYHIIHLMVIHSVVVLPDVHALELNCANGLCLLDTKLSQAPSGLSVTHNNRLCCMAPDGDGSFKFQTQVFSGSRVLASCGIGGKRVTTVQLGRLGNYHI